MAEVGLALEVLVEVDSVAKVDHSMGVRLLVEKTAGVGQVPLSRALVGFEGSS